MTLRPSSEQLSRRTLGGYAAAAGIGLPLLAACGDESDTATDAGSSSTSSGTSSSASSADPSNGSSSEAAGGLTTTADVEVGGGVIFADEKVVITQPTEGDFKAFSAVCTHQGCIVADVSDGTINCTCHNSKFSIETGEPESGPASSPLDEVDITVTGDEISLA